MKAAVFYQYGDVSNLSIADVSKPKVGKNDVLIRVRATSLNGSDWEFLRGEPFYARLIGLRKPGKQILGSDASGVVEAVGENVTDFNVGDAVFCDNFDRLGALAEWISVPQSKVVLKPDNLSFEQAACVPQGGVIALQGLRKYKEIQSGNRILINGAGGSSGAFAVQMAKQAGAYVVAIDHANKLEFLTELGADEVLDYQKLDLKPLENSFDKIFDLVGQHSLFSFRKMLNATGTYVMVGGRMRDVFSTLIAGSLISLFSSKKMSLLMHIQNREDMQLVARFVESNQLQATVYCVFALSEVRDAFRLFAEQKVLGKVVITP